MVRSYTSDLHYLKWPPLIRNTAQLSDPSWLSHKKGEILFTDGVQKICGPSEPNVVAICASMLTSYLLDDEKVVQARNAKGKVGCKYILSFSSKHVISDVYSNIRCIPQ